MSTIDSNAEARFTIEIKNSKPIELTDLTQSLLGIADEFVRHIELRDPEAAAADVKLYVKEIRSGSIIADIVAISPQLLQGISYSTSVITFSKYLKGAYDYLCGKSDDSPEIDKASYQNLSKILEPIAKDSGSQLNLGTVNGNVFITLNSTDANAAQNAARRLVRDLQEPSNKLHEKVLLYWYQARADATSTAGDKGIIESISTRPVKVICATDTIKLQMILNEENPFKGAFVVDVMVETIKNKPALYKILNLHEKFLRDE